MERSRRGAKVQVKREGLAAILSQITCWRQKCPLTSGKVFQVIFSQAWIPGQAFFRRQGWGSPRQTYSGFLKLPKLEQLNPSLRDQLIRHHRKHKTQISIQGGSWTVGILHGAVSGSAVTSRAGGGTGADVTSHTAQGDRERPLAPHLHLENTKCVGEGCSFYIFLGMASGVP